ncbi:MAG: AsnC family transcriptional regulator [Betaproteobacteria bacterium]|nr:MAG: AsnC family transcriptional regulator [Betaproteobacteria bacterium]
MQTKNKIRKSVKAQTAGRRTFSRLDRIDRQILRLLQADGRMSNVELAGRVHLSPAACLERVRALLGEGFIRGFRAVLDPTAAEVGMLVFVQVVLERTTPDVFDAFKSAVLARPEILECHMIAGGFDYLLKARVKDMRAYREFTASAVWALPGVRETHTYVVMEEVKETTALPLG